MGSRSAPIVDISNGVTRAMPDALSPRHLAPNLVDVRRAKGCTDAEVLPDRAVRCNARLIGHCRTDYIRHSGIGSGAILPPHGASGGVAFTNAAFAITATGDTGNRLRGAGGFFVDHDSARIEINGLGTITILTGTRTFVNNNLESVGFSRAGPEGIDLYNGPRDEAFEIWDMLCSIGPVEGFGATLQWDSDPQIDTDVGVLMFGYCQQEPARNVPILSRHSAR